MIVSKAPGKLFIAGEYAVVNSGYSAILAAVDRFVTVTIEHSTDEGSIISEQYAHLPLKWTRKNNKLVIEKRDNPFHYILEAIYICEQYALELGRSLNIYNLRVDSELDSQEGAKYGLGSSAAVTIATIRALLHLYKIELDDLGVFKLASLAHIKLGSNGSFGDLAASTFTGWISYHSLDRRWVTQELSKHTLVELLALNWPALRIERLPELKSHLLLIAWTKKPASTAALVDEVRREVDEERYKIFLHASQQVVNRIVEGFRNHDGAEVCRMLTENRRLLKELYPSIETEALTKLIESAEAYGSAKTSGAGGGDCGIVFVKKDRDTEPLIDQWSRHGIQRLHLHVFDKNDRKNGF